MAMGYCTSRICIHLLGLSVVFMASMVQVNAQKCDHCTTHPKIIIAKYKCSLRKNEKQLYDAIKGCDNLAEASSRLSSYFMLSNNDFFQLRCLKGCLPPLVLEFPCLRNRLSQQPSDGMGTTLTAPIIPPNIYFTIISGGAAPGIFDLAAMAFEQVLKTMLNNCQFPPYQRKNLLTIPIRLTAAVLSSETVRQYLKLMAPVVKVTCLNNRNLKVLAACRIECLADMLRASGMGQKYGVIIAGGTICLN